MNTEEQPNIKFIYKYSDEYNPKYSNGAIGGVTPTGEIVASFYFERLPLPKTVEQKVDIDGSLSDLVSVDPKDHDLNIIRFIDHGVILNLKSAKGFHAWLGQKILDLERRESSKK